MSQITIQCQLFAEEAARQYLWGLMCDRNTPLVNELLRLVALHPDFLTWRSKGKLSLRTNEGRNHSSSWGVVESLLLAFILHNSYVATILLHGEWLKVDFFIHV